MKKKTLVGLLLLSSISSWAIEGITFKPYGFVRNDFYYNTRQNVESLDGLFSIFPKPIELSGGTDKNVQANSEMLSLFSRVGIDITGNNIFGAKSSARIESDFGGVGTTPFMLRVRQAYLKLNWNNTELLTGQYWHPMAEKGMPSVFNLNTGAPFTSFNWSPQARIKQNLGKTLSVYGAAIYQMQFLSQGPSGSSSSYLKNATVPNLFVGIDNKSEHWTIGGGVDYKTIQPKKTQLSSLSGMVYTQYSDKKFQCKFKTTYGQNLSDQCMLGGYGISGVTTNGDSTYTNFNNLSSFINAVYGTKLQVGIFAGIAKNLGTDEKLLLDKNGERYTMYGYGMYQKAQLINDQTIRIAPQLSYTVSNLKIGLEYEYTSSYYGSLRETGKSVLVKDSEGNSNPVINHRLVAALIYSF